MIMLLMNVYMPCEKNCHDDDYNTILSDVSLLFDRYHPNHVVFGGDMNVDLSRTSPNSRILTDFITDFNLLPCIDFVLILSAILFAVYVDSLFGRLGQSVVVCHIGGHFVGALAYADDVTLVVLSRSGIRTLINVSEQYTLDYAITFNGTKSQLLF